MPAPQEFHNSTLYLIRAESAVNKLKVVYIEHLLKSLDEINPEVEAGWEKEITNRIKAIDEGKVTLVPSDEVLQRLRNR